MTTVLIVKSSVEAFRIPFYERLGDALACDDVHLKVAYGSAEHDAATDLEPKAFRYGLPVANLRFGNGASAAVWQPVLAGACKADLTIVQQGNRNLANHVLQMFRAAGLVRLAFWGHGRNFQAANSDSVPERLKALTSRFVDHWFAYTDMTKRVLLDSCVPENKITVVNNSIDTRAENEAYDSVQPEELGRLKLELGIAHGAPVGIYCGRMYDIKNIPFLVRSVLEIRRQNPTFHFLAVGTGPDANLVQATAEQNPSWFHYLGHAVGRGKARYFKAANFQLLPGAVGLALVDSFAMLTPMITVDISIHGPEFCYLRNGINGLVLENDEHAYAAAVTDLISNPARQDTLREGCRIAREYYTLENMVQHFKAGVRAALADSK